MVPQLDPYSYTGKGHTYHLEDYQRGHWPLSSWKMGASGRYIVAWFCVYAPYSRDATAGNRWHSGRSWHYYYPALIYQNFTSVRTIFDIFWSHCGGDTSRADVNVYQPPVVAFLGYAFPLLFSSTSQFLWSSGASPGALFYSTRCSDPLLPILQQFRLCPRTRSLERSTHCTYLLRWCPRHISALSNSLHIQPKTESLPEGMETICSWLRQRIVSGSVVFIFFFFGGIAHFGLGCCGLIASTNPSAGVSGDFLWAKPHHNPDSPFGRVVDKRAFSLCIISQVKWRLAVTGRCFMHMFVPQFDVSRPPTTCVGVLWSDCIHKSVRGREWWLSLS